MTLRYKFLKEGFKSASGNLKWKKGVWQHEKQELNICSVGLHCSKQINQAFSYIQGEILATVEVKGRSIIQEDKECWSDMRIVKAYKWKKEDSIALAIFSAELVIDIFEKKYPTDDGPRKAIEAAKAYVKKPTKENKDALSVAAYAAYAAYAASAAYAAYADYAAYAASEAYADYAAYAAYVAAYAAYAAANAAANAAERKELVSKIESWMKRRIKKLEVI